jgi:hypothetical protein
MGEKTQKQIYVQKIIGTIEQKPGKKVQQINRKANYPGNIRKNLRRNWGYDELMGKSSRARKSCSSRRRLRQASSKR